MFSRPFVKHNCGRDGGIERLGSFMHRDRECHITSNERFFSNTHTFISDYKRAWCIKCFRSHISFSIHRETVDPKPFFLEHLERVIYITNSDEWNTEYHPGRCLHHSACDACLIMFRNKDSCETEGGGRTNDSADVVWVLHLA